MKLASLVYKCPEDCAGALTALAAMRKITGKRQLFCGNGSVMCDSVPKYSNDTHTCVRRVKGSPKGTPKIPDGSDIEAYYISYNGDVTDEQKAATANAIANGMDPRLIKGKLCDVTFAKEGHAIMMVTNSLRTSTDGGPSYRVLSLKTGCIVAMAFNRSLGISPDKLKQEGDKYERNYRMTHPLPEPAKTGDATAAAVDAPDPDAVKEPNIVMINEPAEPEAPAALQVPVTIDASDTKTSQATGLLATLQGISDKDLGL